MAKVTRAIFPAAGLGTRFLPATKSVPKEMLPLVDKPLIQYAVEEVAASGIEEVILVTARGKGCIEDHFDYALDLEALLKARGKTELLALLRSIADLCRVNSVRQKEALGLGHAVYAARHLIPPGEPAAVVLADDIMDCPVPCMRQMLDAFETVQAPIIAAMEVPDDQTDRYGIFQVEPVEGSDTLLRVTDMVEKPAPGTAPSNLAAIGRYIITQDVFDALAKTPAGAGGEIQLTDAFRSMLATKPIYAFRFAGDRYDGGDKLGFLQACIAFALKDPELAEPLREHMRQLSDA